MKSRTWTLQDAPCVRSRADAPAMTSISYIQAQDRPDWEFPLHVHEKELEISVILNGEAEMYWAGNIFTVAAGDVVVKNAGVLHAERSNPKDPIEQICVAFQGVRLPDKQENHIFPVGVPPILHHPDSFALLSELSRYILKLCLISNNGYTGGPESPALSSAMAAFVDVVVDALPQADSSGSVSKGNQTVLQVIEYLDQHYNQKLSLQDMAMKFYISPFYLERKFKEHTGFTFNQYVINRRIGEAEKLLVFGNMDMQQIAGHCGFSSAQYFYASFKKYTGNTPKQFREKYRS